MRESIQQNFVRVNGVQLHYEEYNHGKNKRTIVLLHGFLSSSFCFRKLIPYLVNNFHVISVDWPPFGKSEKLKTYRYSYKNIATTILRLIITLGYDRFYIAGHSMGGQIALNMMHQRPDLIQKGVLLCSTGYYRRAKPIHMFASYLPFFPSFIKYYLNKSGVIGNLKSVVYDQSLIDDEMIRGYSEPFNDKKIFSALTRLLRHREGDLPKEIIQTIETKCLLLWGEHDQIVLPEIGQRLASDLPNAQFIQIKQAGHLITEEKPKEVYEKMFKFLED